MLPVVYSSLFIAALLLIILLTEWPVLARRRFGFWLLSPIYPILPFIMLIALNQDRVCRPLLGLVLLLSAVHDTGSYIIGNLFGHHKIVPTISPGKTWEGFCGGLVSTMAVLMAVIVYMKIPFQWYIFLVLSSAISVLAFSGDLFESWLKRKAGVKDSGLLLPGHGGLLDRLDSVLFVVVFIYLCKNYLC
jgi:phosphatidate cytidylyltransferase